MLKKPKISKSEPIWSDKLEKEYQKEIKNSSKISVIKERLKKSIGKVVYIYYSSEYHNNSLDIKLKGTLTSFKLDSIYYQIESECFDHIQFSIKDIKSITIMGKSIRIRLKL